MNFFNFFPVGQGLFYAGILDDENYSFVFDCGTETAHVNLVSYINLLKHWNGEKNLDFVAVSHFDRDHISGLKDLVEIIGIKNLIIPYICSNKEIRDLYIAMTYIESCGDNLQLTSETLLWLIHYFNEKDSYRSGDFEFCSNNWTFKIFQKQIDDDTLCSLEKKLEDYKIKNGIESVISIIESGAIFDIKKIYTNVFGKNLNKYGIVLLHYPNPFNFSYVQYYPNSLSAIYSLRRFPFSPYFCYLYFPYTLLTGDAEFDGSFARRIQSNFPTGISGIIQAPHHGSDKNWGLFKKNFPGWNNFNEYIVPVGTTNGHGHPSPIITTDVTCDKYNKVTEYIGFPYWIY